MDLLEFPRSISETQSLTRVILAARQTVWDCGIDNHQIVDIGGDDASPTLR